MIEGFIVIHAKHGADCISKRSCKNTPQFCNCQFTACPHGGGRGGPASVKVQSWGCGKTVMLRRFIV